MERPALQDLIFRTPGNPDENPPPATYAEGFPFHEVRYIEIIYSKDTGTLAVGFRNPTVGQSTSSRRFDLGRGIKAWMSEDGETLYSIEIDGDASGRVDLDAIRLITCDRNGSEEQTVSLPER